MNHKTITLLMEWAELDEAVRFINTEILSCGFVDDLKWIKKMQILERRIGEIQMSLLSTGYELRKYRIIAKLT